MAASGLEDISHTIQLAIAPVFLLTALGTTISVLTTRLSRIIDRARYLEEGFEAASDAQKKQSRTELDLLSQRARLIHRALTSGVASALAVCLLIMLAFFGYLFQRDLGQPVALLFIVALALFVYALICFLGEVFRSVQSLRFGMLAVLPAKPEEDSAERQN